ncbi:MAG: LLM class flavin-dependent oxidoreductase [Thaumarchaeota archaeon]|nr:LLM class flavin-dependent oxidoreductase [Nitrososphaerota archaeon]
MKAKFGVYVNNRAPLYIPDFTPPKLIQIATEAEKLGFHSVWVGDSVLAKPRLEPMSVLSAMAAVTQHVKLGTSIFQPHLRNPVWTALSWASLDLLSSGRTILGAGMGGGPKGDMDREASLFNVPPKERAQKMEECIMLLKKLWSQEVVNHAGKYYNLSGLSMHVRPYQKPHPPVWIAAGGGGTLSLRRQPSSRTERYERVVRAGEGWFMGPSTPEEYGEAWRTIQEICKSRYRSPDTVSRALETWANVNRNMETAVNEGRQLMEAYYRVKFDEKVLDRIFMGTPGDCVKKIEEFLSHGLEYLVLVFHGKDQFAQLKLFAEEVLPSF